jgi:Uma2 family endonuclease
MPTAVAERPVLVEAAIRRKRWTRQEVDAFAATGLWSAQKDDWELVGGDLIQKMPKKRPHTYLLIMLQNWLVQTFGVQFVNPETPIQVSPDEVSTNRPEPDLIVLRRPSRDIMESDPLPGDLRLVVEISESSLSFDLTVKADLYARAGIVEYWVVDVQARRIVVHRNVSGGQYLDVQSYSAPETVSPLAAAGKAVNIAELFPR